MKRRGTFKLALCMSSFIVVLLVVLSLPVFNIEEIEIIGNEQISAEYVKSIISQGYSKSFFSLSGSAVKKELLSNPYIKNVGLKKTFPDKITISISERKVSGYVQYMNGEFIYIDDEGTVLEVAPNFTERLPVVVGLDFQGFSVGQAILPENRETFEIVVELQYLFTKYEMEHDIIRVDLGDEDNIHMFIYNIDVDFGGIANADEKIRALKEVLKNIPDVETVHGFLNMNTINKNELARFRILT